MNTPNSSQSARVKRPERLQVEMQFYALDELVPADHRVRLVWQFVKGLDLEPFYQDLTVSCDAAGRPAIAPEILTALWLLATLEGIGSARELARRCERDVVYRWICGGVGVNYHTLSDFRVLHGERLERLLVDTIAALVDRELISLETVAQDGMRVKVGAGSSSFRRRPTLEQLQESAQRHLDRLRETAEEGGAEAADVRRRAARPSVRPGSVWNASKRR